MKLRLTRLRSLSLVLAATALAAISVTPAGAVDPPVANDDVYLTHEGTQLVVNDTHHFERWWGGYGFGDGQFRIPGPLVVDDAGDVHVLEIEGHRVQKFTRNGNYLDQWGTEGDGDGELRFPGGMAVSESGNFYVADSWNDRVQVFASDGTYLDQWGATGTGDGQFDSPKGVAVDTAGNVYVADYRNHRIQKFSPDGTYLDQWGTNGTGPGEFDYPNGLALSDNGILYVVDSLNTRVQVFTTDGTYLDQWGGDGTGIGEFRSPRGIAVDAAGSVYVADGWNGRIQKFTADGEYLTHWNGGLGDLQIAIGVAVDSAGSIFASEGNDSWTTERVHRFGPAGVLGNDYDSDDDTLTVVVDTDVSHGSLIMNPGGGFLYTPGAGFVGTDSFTYYADDGANQSDLATATIHVEATGFLRVTTDPAVPSQIIVDGEPRDSWGLTWVKMPSGTHKVTFTDIQGYSTPDPQIVVVDPGATTDVTGGFTERGWLQVTTNPALPATIYVDGAPMNDWGMWTDFEPGTYEVCFGDVADHATPRCQMADITAGALTSVGGDYVASPGAQAPSGHGYLRVTTNPAVPAQIVIDGIPRDTWGLTWLKLDPGTYEVAFTDIQSYTTPEPQAITVTADETTLVQGDYIEEGWMHVTTSPPLPATIFASGIPMNDWGMWTHLPTSGYAICFSPIPGYTTPECAGLGTVPGETTEHEGVYVPIP